MAFRKIKAKTYNGILEYYNPKSVDKETRSLYLSYRDEFGKTKKIKLSSIDKVEALSEADSIRNKVRVKSREIKTDSESFLRAVRNQDLTLEQLAVKYFNSRNTKNNDKDRRVFNNRIPVTLKHKKIKKITSDDITIVVAGLKKSNYAPKTINITIDLLGAVFAWSIKRGLSSLRTPVSRDKADINFIEKEPVSTEVGRVLNEKEILDLWLIIGTGGKKENQRLYLFMRLCYFTGARPDAILTLQVKDINIHESKVRIKAMKKSSDYMQKLRDEVLEELKAWIADHDLFEDEMYIFYPNKVGTSVDKYKHTGYDSIGNSARAVFDDLFNVGRGKVRSLRRVTLYSLRRTSATVVYRSKGLAVASRFLHHSDVKTTMRYLGIDEDLEVAIDVL